MSKELVQAMDLLEEEKGISREIVKEALESALELAYKKNYEQASNVEINFDEESGSIKVYAVKEVVETNYDSQTEISLEEALKINRAYEIGDKIRFEVTPKDFGRIATQTAKHVIMQRIREAEREVIYNEFIDYQDEILTGTIERVDQRAVYVNLGRAEAAMPNREQIPNEIFELDQRVKVYVENVDKTTRGAQIIVSRAHPDFLRRLFEQEVPEIYDGIVEIMSIAREAGDRSKIAVRSRDEQIDPVGTCVGQGGTRVQRIVAELNGENMDIIEYSDDPEVYIKNAINPADVLKVDFDEEAHSCIVVVPDEQLSLAIGKRGQNARLAARLTSYKIDIKSESDYEEYLEELEEQKAQQATEDTLESLDEESIDDIIEEVKDGEVDNELEYVENPEEIVENEAQIEVENKLIQDDIDEQNYGPDEIEEAIDHLEELSEDESEQSYDKLVEEVEQEHVKEELEE